jgi:hypothetical protein
MVPKVLSSLRLLDSSASIDGLPSVSDSHTIASLKSYHILAFLSRIVTDLSLLLSGVIFH